MITAYNKTARGRSRRPRRRRPRATSSSAATPTSSSTPAAPAAPQGQWAAFSARENKDAGKIVAWAHSRTPWSNGKVGMTGASYMGISQLLAAGHQPPGLKAIFPQVPATDVYRDVVASGGQIDVGFIPLWLGLVTGTGLIPPAYAASDPASGFGAARRPPDRRRPRSRSRWC